MEEVKHSTLRLSVITINLNDAQGLETTIQSIVNQGYTDFELIVIDGGSKDGSVDIINNYSDRISYWVSEADKGIYNAMNKGIAHAKGEYCFFLNSGDHFVSNKVLDLIFKEPINEDIIYGNLMVCDNVHKKTIRSVGKAALTFLDLYTSSLKHQATFIRRALFEKSGFYDEDLEILADWAFFLKTVGLEGATTKYLNIDISFFDDNGISNDPSPKAVEDRIAQRNKVLKAFLPSRIREDYEDFAAFDKYKKLMNHNLSVFVLKTLNKGVTLYEKLLRI
jgi:glycosyltransferase involved in cell wall biosynthesis